MSVRLPKTFAIGPSTRIPFGPDVNKPVPKPPRVRYAKMHAAVGGVDVWLAEWDRLVALHGNPISREGYLPVLKDWSAYVKRVERGLPKPETNGQARKAEGIAQVAQGEDRKRWLAAALAWVGSLPSGYVLTADDIRDMIGDPPHPNLAGAAVNGAARLRLIEADGFVTATRPERHGSVLRRWVRR